VRHDSDGSCQRAHRETSHDEWLTLTKAPANFGAYEGHFSTISASCHYAVMIDVALAAARATRER
jgi:hypothetical protein